MESKADPSHSKRISPQHSIIEHSSTKRFSRFDELLRSTQDRKVYRAIDNNSGREVSWNILQTPELNQTERDRLPAVFHLSQTLNHPSILKCVWGWHSPEATELVFITEMTSGGNLRQHLQRLWPPSVKAIKQWSRQILLGLEFLHSKGIVHGELKCESLFVDPCASQVKIGDLEASVIKRRTGSEDDLFRFGLCVIEMCTYGEYKSFKELYSAVTTMEKSQAIKSIANEDVKEFVSLCLKCPSKRPTASQLLSHRFLHTEDCTLRPEDSEEKTVGLSLNIRILEVSGKTTVSALHFKYNLALDTPDSLSTELITVFSLDPSCSQQLRCVLQHKVLEKSETPLTSDISSKNSSFGPHELRPSPFSTGNISPIETHPQSTEHTEHFLSLVKELQSIRIPPLSNTLARYSRNNRDEVAALQRALGLVLGTRVSADGHFSSKTESLVKKYQEDVGLLVNGVVNKPFWENLMDSYERKMKWQKTTEETCLFHRLGK